MNDTFFRIAFFTTLVIMLGVFSTNIQKPQETQRPVSSTGSLQRFDMEKIQRLIRAGQLSNREAMYYKVIE